MAGNRHGYGIFRTAQGGTYEGDWQQDAPHGTGKYKDSKISYSGHWANSKRHGYGELTNTAGLKYEGTWNNNKRQGFGREERPDGSVYEGEWSNDKRHGEGVETRADNSYHDGIWEQNQALGPGIRRDPLGFEISGVWNADYVNHGILRLPDGLEYAGSLYLEQNTQIAKKFLAWLKNHQENPFAQYLLGNAYSEFTVPQIDMEAAQISYTKSARHNFAPAKFKLANIYFAEKIRVSRALELLLEAAEADYTDALVLLGTYYHLGTHLPKNHRIAKDYYTRASVKGNLVARNNVAWLMATSPDDNVRDGTEAVALAQPLALMFSSWGYLDTLAAAFAEAGNFQSAIITQKQALASLAKDNSGHEQVAAQMLRQLALFEQGSPYREP
jgi:TPR repeat protein